MLSDKDYKDNPQTYVKHVFLEYYLGRVAYNIFSFKPDIVYVDGFSGPWKSNDEQYGDTSFAIAISELKKARRNCSNAYSVKKVRCFFTEENTKSYNELVKYTSSVKGIDCKCYNGLFVDAINEAIKYIDKSFSFSFIDPIGFTGFGMNSIKPLLSLRGEVLINFMYTQLNRFIDHPDPEQQKNYDELFGYSEWNDDIKHLESTGQSRENAILQTYCAALKKAGNYKHVTSTRILFGTKNRTYFYLIYATHHPKGLIEFRKAEQVMLEEQEHVRNLAKLKKTMDTSKTLDLFAPEEEIQSNTRKSTLDSRNENLMHAREMLLQMLSSGPLSYMETLTMLEIPYVSENDMKDIVGNLYDQKKITMINRKPKQRRFGKDHTIALISPQ